LKFKRPVNGLFFRFIENSLHLKQYKFIISI